MHRARITLLGLAASLTCAPLMAQTAVAVPATAAGQEVKSNTTLSLHLRGLLDRNAEAAATWARLTSQIPVFLSTPEEAAAMPGQPLGARVDMEGGTMRAELFRDPMTLRPTSALIVVDLKGLWAEFRRWLDAERGRGLLSAEDEARYARSIEEAIAKGLLIHLAPDLER